MPPNETLPPADSTESKAPAARRKRKGLLAFVIGLLVAAVVLAILYVVNPGGIFSTLKDTGDPVVVTITSSGFSPETIKIKKGQAVEWVNEDSSPHQVAADPFPDHSSLPHLYAETPLTKGESFAYTFDDPGTYTYHDQLRPAQFKGTIIVER